MTDKRSIFVYVLVIGGTNYLGAHPFKDLKARGYMTVP